MSSADTNPTGANPTDANAGGPNAGGTAAEDSGAHPWHVGRLITAWAIAAVFGVFIAVFASPVQRPSWLVLAIGVATLVTFALQLGTAQREGFITRTAFSVAGSVVVIAVIDGVQALLP